MTIKEKLRQNLTGHLSNDKTEVDVNIAATIADDYAIEFANWFAGRYTEAFFYEENYTDNLLKEFKKEKGL
jgi:hypothetical protein